MSVFFLNIYKNYPNEIQQSFRKKFGMLIPNLVTELTSQDFEMFSPRLQKYLHEDKYNVHNIMNSLKERKLMNEIY